MNGDRYSSGSWPWAYSVVLFDLSRGWLRISTDDAGCLHKDTASDREPVRITDGNLPIEISGPFFFFDCCLLEVFRSLICSVFVSSHPKAVGSRLISVHV